MGICTVVLVPFALTGCARIFPSAPDVSPTARESLTVWEAVQGEWLVSQTQDMMSSYVEDLGVLTVDGVSYAFSATTGAESVSAVDQRLQFLFDAPEGEVRLEFVDGVQGSDNVRLFDEYATLAICTFETEPATPGFLILVGEGDSLFFHSSLSEISLWSISKGFDQGTHQ